MRTYLAPYRTLARISNYSGLPAGGLVERERRGQLVVGVDLRLEIGDLLLGKGNGIGAGDEAARRRLLASDPDERSRQLGRIAGLPPVLRLPPLELLRPAVCVVLNGPVGKVIDSFVRSLVRKNPGLTIWWCGCRTARPRVAATPSSPRDRTSTRHRRNRTRSR